MRLEIKSFIEFWLVLEMLENMIKLIHIPLFEP